MKTIRTSLQRAGVLAIVAAAMMAAQPAHAIIVYEDPGRLTTMPVLSGSVKPGWQYIGNYNGFGGVPIGPRAWVTATHVTAASMNFWYDNAGQTAAINYQGTRVAVNNDLAVAVLNEDQPDFTAWAPVWSGTNNISIGQQFYMYGYGTPRGTPITGGWNWGAYDFVMSYGTNQLSSLATVVGNTQFKMTFTQPTIFNGVPGTEGIFSWGDSGSGLFAYNNANTRWELIGINSAVEQVSATSNGPVLDAALYDARGYYNGTTLITGAVNVPLSSYAIALPYYESFLSPYIVEVPEPATWSLLGVAAALGLLAKRRSRRVSGPLTRLS
ncbi:MAG: trypsin-like serine protease [Pirellulales bacterium]